MLDQYSRAAPRWQLDFGITFCVPHRRLGLQCSANVGGSSLCTSGYVTLLCRLSAQLGHGDRCRESRESAEDWRWVMAAAGGEVATRPVVKIHCERHSIERGLTPIDKDPIKEVSGRSHPPGLQAGAKPALPPAAAHGSDSILSLYRSEAYRCPSALYAPWGLCVELHQMSAAATSLRVRPGTFCQMTGCVSPGTAIK